MKFKSLKITDFLTLLKCCLIGIVATLAGVVVLAVVLKFADINSNAISWINDIIKGASIFLTTFFLKRKIEGKLLIKSVFAGLFYGILSFIIFSLLNGGFNFNLSVLFDLLFAVIVAAIAAVILTLVKKN